MRRTVALLALALLGTGNAPSRIPLPKGFRPSALAADGGNLIVSGENGQLLVIHDRAKLPAPIAAGANPSALDARHGLIAVANHESDYVTLISGATPRTLRLHSKPHPHAVAIGDFDRDGKPDLAVDSWMENRIMLLFGRDDYRGPGTPLDIGTNPYWTISAADMDGDGNVDLVTPNAGKGTVSILLGDGRGGFAHAPGSPFAAGVGAFSAAIGDVNGDRRPDVVVANYSGHANDTSHDGLTWIRNDGNRRFTPFAERVAKGNYSARIAAGDVNGDRFADAVFTNTNAATVTIVYGSPSGPLHAANVAVMPHPHAVAIAGGEIVVASEESDELLVVRGK